MTQIDLLRQRFVFMDQQLIIVWIRERDWGVWWRERRKYTCKLFQSPFLQQVPSLTILCGQCWQGQTSFSIYRLVEIIKQKQRRSKHSMMSCDWTSTRSSGPEPHLMLVSRGEEEASTFMVMSVISFFTVRCWPKIFRFTDRYNSCRRTPPGSSSPPC